MHLSALTSATDIFHLLALDDVARMIERFGLPVTEPETDDAIRKILTAMQQLLASSSSGVVIDPMYGFHLSRTKPADVGVAYRLEKLTSEIDPLALPILIGNWGVTAVRHNYGVAKLELYYHPREECALEKKQLLAELYDYCKHEGIALLLKLVVYTPADETFSVARFQSAQMEAVRELSPNCSLLALQFPQDALTCATLTAELDVPWILIGDDIAYDEFKDILRTSLDNGARGYMVDEVLWREIYEFRQEDGFPGWTAVGRFLQSTARDRSIELARIANESKQDE